MYQFTWSIHLQSGPRISTMAELNPGCENWILLNAKLTLRPMTKGIEAYVFGLKVMSRHIFSLQKRGRQTGYSTNFGKAFSLYLLLQVSLSLKQAAL